MPRNATGAGRGFLVTLVAFVLAPPTLGVLLLTAFFLAEVTEALIQVPAQEEAKRGSARVRLLLTGAGSTGGEDARGLGDGQRREKRQ